MNRYNDLSRNGYFYDEIGAQGSYFVFVKVPVSLDDVIAMDQEFFDTTSYPGAVRFNLLLPMKELNRYKEIVHASKERF